MDLLLRKVKKHSNEKAFMDFLQQQILFLSIAIYSSYYTILASELNSAFEKLLNPKKSAFCRLQLVTTSLKFIINF